MNTEIHVSVETCDRYGDLCTDINLTWEATMQHTKAKETFSQFAGDGKAKVSISLSEKIGGPQYSSVSVMVTVSLTCNQDEETINKAAGAAHTHTISLLDSYIEDALDGLHAHLEREGRKGRGG